MYIQGGSVYIVMISPAESLLKSKDTFETIGIKGSGNLSVKDPKNRKKLLGNL